MRLARLTTSCSGVQVGIPMPGRETRPPGPVYDMDPKGCRFEFGWFASPTAVHVNAGIDHISLGHPSPCCFCFDMLGSFRSLDLELLGFTNTNKQQKSFVFWAPPRPHEQHEQIARTKRAPNTNKKQKILRILSSPCKVDLLKTCRTGQNHDVSPSSCIREVLGELSVPGAVRATTYVNYRGLKEIYCRAGSISGALKACRSTASLSGIACDVTTCANLCPVATPVQGALLHVALPYST